MSTSPPNAGASLLPDLGPGWQLVRSLGQGGVGEVFEAVHPRLGRVAVKVLHAAHQERADVVDRMRLEAEILGHLRHPNIVEQYEMGTTPDGRPFYAMEYLTGESLRAALERRARLPLAEAVTVACDALAGLGAAHDRNIIHRDVKPGNIYLVEASRGPRVKLVDFGIAKLVTTRGAAGPAPLVVPTAKGTVLGTPRYLSPEQIAGRPLDARADLYAVGLVLYRMVVGKGPFDDIQDFADMMRAQVTLMPPFPSSHGVVVPRWFDLVVMKALAKKPEDRFASAAEFAHQLERAIDPARRVVAREVANVCSSTAGRLPSQPARDDDVDVTREVSRHTSPSRAGQPSIVETLPAQPVAEVADDLDVTREVHPRRAPSQAGPPSITEALPLQPGAEAADDVDVIREVHPHAAQGPSRQASRLHEDTLVTRARGTARGAPPALMGSLPSRSRRMTVKLAVVLTALATLPWLVLALAWASASLDGRR